MAGTEGNISMFFADNGFAAKCNNCYRLFIYAGNEPKSVPARDPGDCKYTGNAALMKQTD